jgi:hypothetical protein
MSSVFVTSMLYTAKMPRNGIHWAGFCVAVMLLGVTANVCVATVCTGRSEGAAVGWADTVGGSVGCVVGVVVGCTVGGSVGCVVGLVVGGTVEMIQVPVMRP